MLILMTKLCSSSNCVCVLPSSSEPLTAGGRGVGVMRVGVSGDPGSFDSPFSSSGSSTSGRRGGGGGGARLGHWPISAFSKDTGWEKSESLIGGGATCGERQEGGTC